MNIGERMWRDIIKEPPKKPTRKVGVGRIHTPSKTMEEDIEAVVDSYLKDKNKEERLLFIQKLIEKMGFSEKEGMRNDG